MILDQVDPLWVHIIPETQKQLSLDYREHYGKWVIYGSRERVERLAGIFDTLVELGKIDQIKYIQKLGSDAVTKKMHAMHVYCDDRERERVWKLLEVFGATRRIWKYEWQTVADWQPGCRLEIEARTKSKSERCGSFDSMFPIYMDRDYVVRIGVRDFKNNVEDEQERVVMRVKREYGIKGGSCAGAILDYLKAGISQQGKSGYSSCNFLYDKLKKWSRSTVRKNMKMLEGIGVLQRKYFSEISSKYPTLFLELIGTMDENERDAFFRQRIFEVKLHFARSYVEQPPRPEDSVVTTGIRTVKEGEVVSLKKGEGIVDRVDLRNLSEREKRREAVRILKKRFSVEPVVEFRHIIEHKDEIIGQMAKEAKYLPNIAELNLVGSVANNDVKEHSDMDVLAVREYCPGYQRCGSRFAIEFGVGLFCFTGEEMQEARKKKMVILAGAQKLYDKSGLHEKNKC